jgi:hypothetical protein
MRCLSKGQKLSNLMHHIDLMSHVWNVSIFGRERDSRVPRKHFNFTKSHFYIHFCYICWSVPRPGMV